MRTCLRALEDPKSLFSSKYQMVSKRHVFTTLHILLVDIPTFLNLTAEEHIFKT